MCIFKEEKLGHAFRKVHFLYFDIGKEDQKEGRGRRRGCDTLPTSNVDDLPLLAAHRRRIYVCPRPLER